jgi:hypothetical protein
MQSYQKGLTLTFYFQNFLQRYEISLNCKYLLRTVLCISGKEICFPAKSVLEEAMEKYFFLLSLFSATFSKANTTNKPAGEE